MNPYEGGDEYANPAITPGNPGSDMEEDSPPEDEEAPDDVQEDQKEEEEDDQAQNKALMSVMAHMTGVEVRRLEKHSKKANAINEIESFYVKWEETLGNAIERVDHDRALAAKHCEESKDMLRAALTGNSEDDLPTLVARVTEDWDLRYAGG